MTNLVQVPYQKECWLTPDTLALLQEVNGIVGTELRIDGADGAWRSWDRQNYLWTGFILHLPGFNTASSPNPPGQRNHMRGGAFDLVRTDAVVQAACRKVGLVRDSAEPWHWNNPNAANMPIIPANDALAVSTVTVLRNKELGEIMSAIHLNGVKDSGIIVRGSDVPYAMEESVFVATANGLGLSIIQLEKWQYDTVVREQWTAHASAAHFSNTSVDPKDVDSIVQRIRDSFPAPDNSAQG